MSLPAAWIRRLALVGGFVLGAVLLTAAWSKALDPVAFAEEIERQGLAIGLGAPLLAVLFVGFEVGLGSLLLLGVLRRWVLLPTAALVALFLFLNARAYWRFSQGLIDASESCGCFGNLLQRTPAQAFWQDLLLLLPPLVVAFLGLRRGGRVVDWRALAAGVLALASLLLAWKAPDLPLDDLATRLSPGVEVSGLCAGSSSGDSLRICLDALLPELEQGRHLVVIAALDEEVGGGIEDLNRRAAEPGGPEVWMLTSAEASERQAFYWQWAPAFEIREIPQSLLRPLYRSLPRSFVVEDGQVEETYRGLPPPGP